MPPFASFWSLVGVLEVGAATTLRVAFSSSKKSDSPGWISSAGRPRRSRSRSCWPPPETCLPSPAAWPGHPLPRGIPTPWIAPSSFPRLYSAVELKKHVRVKHYSVVLTGLASSVAEKAGSQLLLNVELAGASFPFTISTSLAEIEVILSQIHCLLSSKLT